MTLENELKKYFQMSEFRIGQKEIITDILSGKDVLAVLPTGGGKSLCYQLPAFILGGLTLVISPLVALMNDQVKGLRQRGLACGTIHSGMKMNEKKQVFKDLETSESFILFVSPERTQHPGFLPWLKNQKLSLIAVDEAHCVSQWGHDFRTEYSLIHQVKQDHEDVPVIALTATATPIVKTDIIKQLKLKKPAQHVYGFYRPNLYYQIEFCDNEAEKESYILGALAHFTTGKVIMYCGTRKKTEEWADKLESIYPGQVDFYHAGMSNDNRSKIEKLYADGHIRILTATNAFGMGIDHPDVRLVVHLQMPANIESYYQEVGRAGRDGDPSTCLMTYSKKDKGLQSFFIQQSDAKPKIKVQRWSSLNAMIQYSEGSDCRHGEILTYFKDSFRLKKCGHCDSCDPQSLRKVQPHAITKSTKTKRRKKPDVSQAPLTGNDQILYETLKDWRRDYAQEKDMPAFMIFSDKTLRDLVDKKPLDSDQLSDVYGFGPKKVEHLGELVVTEIRNFC